MGRDISLYLGCIPTVGERSGVDPSFPCRFWGATVDDGRGTRGRSAGIWFISSRGGAGVDRGGP